jgi:capsular polysaccharide biosynthesis protein
MEEETVELVDYLRVIWKRKILIIVGTLVCIVAGVVMSRSMQRAYIAEAVIRIGKKVQLQAPSTTTTTTSTVSSTLVILESPLELVKSIPIKYGQDVERDFGFHLDAEVIGKSSMIKVIVRGTDKRVEKSLKEIADKIVDKYIKMVETSAIPYKILIERLEADAIMIQDNVADTEGKLKDAKNVEEEILGNIAQLESNIGISGIIEEKIQKSIIVTGGKEGIISTNIVEVALMDMLLRRIVNNEESLRKDRNSLESIRRQLLMYRTFLGSLKEYNTELIGAVTSVAIQPRKKRKIVLAGVIGLMMFTFLAFFKEYLDKVKAEGR